MVLQEGRGCKGDAVVPTEGTFSTMSVGFKRWVRSGTALHSAGDV